MTTRLGFFSTFISLWWLLQWPDRLVVVAAAAAASTSHARTNSYLHRRLEDNDDDNEPSERDAYGKSTENK